MMFRQARLVVAIAAVTLGWCACTQRPAPTSGPTTYSVTIDGVKFVPETVTVHPGDSIVWTNKDPFAHTVTSEAGGFDSGSFDAGATWTYTATKTGRFDYVCTFHRTMKGTVRVE